MVPPGVGGPRNAATRSLSDWQCNQATSSTILSRPTGYSVGVMSVGDGQAEAYLKDTGMTRHGMDTMVWIPWYGYHGMG